MSRFALKFLTVMLVLMTVPAWAEITNEPMVAFSFSVTTDMAGTPEEVFDAATGDITPWWDHTMSGKPLKMYVEPKPGGAFMEIFNEKGDGVRHAVVTGVERGKFIRLEGPMGLAGYALFLVTTWNFEPAETEGRTQVTISVRGSGEVQEGWPELIERTWHHFLVECLKPYLEKE
jgi:hypothetical protein